MLVVFVWTVALFVGVVVSNSVIADLPKDVDVVPRFASRFFLGYARQRSVIIDFPNGYSSFSTVSFN